MVVQPEPVFTEYADSIIFPYPVIAELRKYCLFACCFIERFQQQVYNFRIVILCYWPALDNASFKQFRYQEIAFGNSYSQ
jgi:hypothetical protein